MPTLTATVSTTKEITIKPALRTKLLKEFRLYAALRDQLKAIESAMDKHKANIGKIRDETGEQSLNVDGFKVTLVAPIRSSLDKAKLIAQGVTIAQIENATVHKPGRAYEKLTLPGQQEREED